MRGIGIDEDEPLAAGGLRELMARPVFADPSRGQFRAVNDAEPRVMKRAQDFAGTVLGTVVEHNHLEIRPVLRQHRTDALRDVVSFVAGGNEHRNQRTFLRWGGRREAVEVGDIDARRDQHGQQRHEEDDMKSDDHGSPTFTRNLA